MKESVLKKYPSHPIELCIAPFLFLRFFVAGITVPESFGFSFIFIPFFTLVSQHFPGITEDIPSPLMRRRLILIAKVISNMSTQVKFGEKEEYMKVMNDYLDSKKDEFSKFYDHVCQVSFFSSLSFQPSSSPPTSEERVEVPSRHLNASLNILAFAAAMVESGEWELMDDDDGELQNITFV